MANYLIPKIISIGANEYVNFIERLPELKQQAPNISLLKKDELLQEATAIAGVIFSEIIKDINVALSDQKSGIIAADIAESNQLSADENAYWGVVIALALAANIFELAKDYANKTPYTMYAASYEKAKALAGMGLEVVAPETKLGFHTDGTIKGSHVSMPHNIMLYNLVIEYDKPGNFYGFHLIFGMKKNISWSVSA